jgi:hypothetical protein
MHAIRCQLETSATLDVNYAGVVNLLDFNLLATHYGEELSAP